MKKNIVPIIFFTIALLIYFSILKSIVESIKFWDNTFSGEIVSVDVKSIEDNPGAYHLYTVKSEKGFFTESLDSSTHDIYKVGDKVFVVQKGKKRVRILTVNDKKVNSIISFSDIMLFSLFVIYTSIIVFYISRKVKKY